MPNSDLTESTTLFDVPPVTRDGCDPDEAPEGYYAVPKASLPHDRGNLCQQCDWRPTCQDPATDFLAPGHRCAGYAIVAVRDGKTYQRNDRCSVVFKRK